MLGTTLPVAAALGGWGLADILLTVVVVAALCAVVVIAVKAMGITVPPWAIQIGWVVAIAVVAILAIRVILSL